MKRDQDGDIPGGGGAAPPHERTALAPEADDGHRARPDERTVLAEGSGGAASAQTVQLRGSGTPAAEVRGTPPPAELAPPGTAAVEVSAQQLIGAGTRIAHYEIIRELGAGGMGTVYLARDTRLGRRVAIKFLQTSHPELTQRFILEARATAQCSHENIVIIYEVGEFSSSPYMVLEYLQGSTLTDLIGTGQRMPPARAAELIVPVVRALVCAHEQNIVHRDLKPDNILVTETGTIKVLDFGIAKVLQDSGSPEHAGEVRLPSAEELGDGATELTRRGAIMGTMSYMSPEQWGIGVGIDHRTDIWAIGIMLFRMVTGKHPLDPLRGNQLVVTAMLDRPMPRVRDAVADVPPALADVIDRCLLKDKEQRFPSARALLRALEPFLPGRFTRELHIDETPYAGLSSFQEADADRFFGRSNEVAAAVTRVRDRPLMAVVGSSGVGKSSFVRAGLVPALKHSGESWETLVVRPGRNPLAALAGIIAPLVGSSTSVVDDISEQEKLVERIRREPGFVGSVLRSRARREGGNILLFVDQFEELYTLVPDADERLAFTACLAGIADDPTAPLRVVLSIRSDFLDRVPEDQHFMTELSQGLFFLTPPNRDGLRDALVQPAEMAGYHFETPDMVEHMLDHLEATPGALPLLQFAASKLWEARDTSRKLLTDHSYQSIGGIAGALAAHADSVVGELPPQAQSLVRDVFMRLVTPERTRAIVSVEELRELASDPAQVQRMVDHMVQARLLVVQTGGGGGESAVSVEIVHESLIHSWPTLRRWLDANHEDAVFLEQLRTAARQWQAKGYDSGLLWRGEAVAEARRFHRRHRGELPQLQRSFLQAVFDLDTRAARRKRLAFAGAFATLCVLVAAAAVALVVIRNSHAEATRQAAAAQLAEAEAKERLAEVQAKERERQRAEALQLEAEKEAAAANTQVDLTLEELQRKNVELEDAVERAESSRRRAKRAQQQAEENEAAARQAQVDALRAHEEALEAKERAEKLLRRERERVERLQDQLGSTVIEDLK